MDGALTIETKEKPEPRFGAIFVKSLALVSADLLILTSLATSVIFTLNRMLKEERMMLEKFGDEYSAYMKRTGLLLPLSRRDVNQTEPA